MYMTQETNIELIENPVILNSALIKCKECKQLVPKTMTCIYCGEPILFTRPL